MVASFCEPKLCCFLLQTQSVPVSWEPSVLETDDSGGAVPSDAQRRTGLLGMQTVTRGMIVTFARVHLERLHTALAHFHPILLSDDGQPRPCSESLQYWDTSKCPSNGGPMGPFKGGRDIRGTVVAWHSWIEGVHLNCIRSVRNAVG